MNRCALIVRGREVLEHVEVATSTAERMRGLLGRRSFEPDHAMLLRPCGSIHTFFMRFALDVVFLDAGGHVKRIVANLKPWRMAWGGLRAHAALELPAGWLRDCPLAEGELVEFTSPVDAGQVSPAGC